MKLNKACASFRPRLIKRKQALGKKAVRLGSKSKTVPDRRTYHSQDIFIKTGLSAEWTFVEYCFVEAGADFIYIFYSGEPMKMLAPSN